MLKISESWSCMVRNTTKGSRWATSEVHHLHKAMNNKSIHFKKSTDHFDKNSLFCVAVGSFVILHVQKTKIYFSAALVFVRKYVNRVNCDSIRHGRNRLISACRARLPCESRACVHVWVRAQECLASTWLRPAFREKEPYGFIFLFLWTTRRRICADL